MNQRRQRYTVILLDEPQPRVILGYTAQGVVDHYNRRGKHVLKIEKGDYRRKTRAREAKANGGFTIDNRALREARTILGLKCPVEIKPHGRHGGTDGNHCFNGTRHRIMVKSYLTPERATHVLWHELTHALQAERDGNGDRETWNRISKAQRRYSYRIRPIEVEAERMAEKMTPTHPLAR